MSKILRLDPIACDGHGLCAELFPERIRLDDWGFPILDPRAVPPPSTSTHGARWPNAPNSRCGWPNGVQTGRSAPLSQIAPSFGPAQDTSDDS